MKTRNVKFCAYLKLKGINPLEVNKIGSGKAEYFFDVEEKDWNKHQVEFNKSEFLNYANALEAIKDLAY